MRVEELNNINKLYGNTDSIKRTVIDRLEAIYEMDFSPDEIAPSGLLEIMAEFTSLLNREVAVYLNRRGKVEAVCVGDNDKVSLPDIEGRRDMFRLSGVRCIHTHPNGNGRLSDVDISTLITKRMDAMIAVGINETGVSNIYAGILKRDENGQLKKTEILGPYYYGSSRIDKIIDVINEVDKQYYSSFHEIRDDEERAILVSLETQDSLINTEDSISELGELAKTAGAAVLDKIIQKRPKQDSALYIGQGKAEELSLLRQALNANLVIFDDELSGAQIRNLENTIGTKVIDRTTLILDIFAKRAHTLEGKLQVELAQLKYSLPRLTGRGIAMSRLGGGIGTRGPGETQLETDRRHINRRIKAIENQLLEVRKRRGELRNARKRNSVPTASLAGYTNAGKSTLINKICNSEIFAEDMLFATLDPSVRKMIDPKGMGREALIVDTVGFIRKLPHDLVDAFRATLEETVYADLIIHVVDASNDEFQQHMEVAENIFRQIGAADIPVFTVFNKIDKLNGEFVSPFLKGADDRKNTFYISAKTGQGIDQLIEAIYERLGSANKSVELLLPFSQGNIVSSLHERAKVIVSDYRENGIYLEAIVPVNMLKELNKYIIDNKDGDANE